MSLIAELKRRNVIRVAVGYLAAAWLLLQIADIVLPRLGFSETSITNLIYIVGIGFFPAVILSWFFEWTSAGLKKDSAAIVETSVTRHKTLDRAIVAILVLALGFFATDKFVFDPARDAAEIEQAEQAARKAALVDSYGDKSIAVLPFRNMSSDPEQEYFSEGIAEELLNLLARVDGLRVISRTSSFALKGEKLATPEISKKLDAANILEGSVRLSGKKIRITVQLIDGPTDTHLWSETYDRELADVFAIQDEVAAIIVEQLKVTMSVGLTPAERHDPQAYAMYLQARQMMSSYTDDLDRVEDLLRQALAIEPGYHDAIVELAWVYDRRADDAYDSSDTALADKYWARSAEIQQEVAEIDPYNLELNVKLTWDNMRHVELAAKHAELALAADPYSLRALNAAVVVMTRLWRQDDAVPIAEYLHSRDPLFGAGGWNLARAYLNNGQFDLAETAYRRILALHQEALRAPWGLGLALLLQGRAQAAHEVFENEVTVKSLSRHGRALALHDLGRHEESKAVLAELIAAESKEATDRNWAYLAGTAYAYIGDTDKAFEYLQMQTQLDSGWIRVESYNPLYRNLEHDSRWEAFRISAKVGLDDLAAVEFDPRLPPDIH